ncbi:hypothetical protein GWI33_020419 [Rhynchophorus ferrugineus]|uniref:Uncharacterized protein n=1 Tax=Rhynchophorus ferrugineus TaxID=354439 RepID=A0A834M5V4_RHYFE|nr:hypothetical protein GWI33_020419 [Rhynchophorus ferrugineus]
MTNYLSVTCCAPQRGREIHSKKVRTFRVRSQIKRKDMGDQMEMPSMRYLFLGMVFKEVCKWYWFGTNLLGTTAGLQLTSRCLKVSERTIEKIKGLLLSI